MRNAKPNRSRARSAKRSARRVSEPSAPYGSLIYVESSALLASILENDSTIARALDAPGRRITSAITLTEGHRGVTRARATGRLDAEAEATAKSYLETIAQRCELVPVSEHILARAGRPFPVEPVRTLDAIHLATLEVLDLGTHAVQVLTRDKRIEANARAMGYRTIPRPE